MSQPTNSPHLIYFADPMCSWCYGFAPVMHAIRTEFHARLPCRVVLGGLRPGTTTIMDAKAKANIRCHWEHVQEASGQKFDFAFFERDDFIYNTEPACRAVVLARRQSPDAALDLLDRLHLAFYAQNRDITQPHILAELAAALGFDPVRFAEDLADPLLHQETWQDFHISQQTGVTGFPTLIVGTDPTQDYALVTAGFQPPHRIIPALTHWLTKQIEPA